MVDQTQHIGGAAAAGAAGQPRKLAVLGGGMGSLSAVFELTSEPGWQQRYDITVYQVGWRLGGKGASGRNMDDHGRIEEHGVHVFFGFYTNAFSVMKACYEELGRPPGSLLATWQDAFKGMNHLVLPERLPGGTVWEPWSWDPPAMEGRPTDDLSEVSMRHVLETAAAWFSQGFDGLFSFTEELAFTDIGDAGLRISLASQQHVLDQLVSAGVAASAKSNELRADVEQFLGVPALAEEDALEHVLEGILATFGAALKLYWVICSDAVAKPQSRLARQMRKTWIVCNFIYANLLGLQESGLLHSDFDSINDLEYRDWLAKYALDDDGATVRDSVLVRWVYDAVFAYKGGDIGAPSLEAGTTLQILIRVLLTYGGEFLYKMQAGMGDVVFAPLYLVLRKRGVKFEFFHRVLELEVGQEQGKPVISGIRFEQQAQMKAGAPGSYDPLVTIQDTEGKTLPCWPAAPRYELLENGADLKVKLAAAGYDLEAYEPSPAPHGKEYTLGRDQFDQVILGIGLGAAKVVCRQLIAGNAQWATMVDKVGTVATMGAQLWLRRDLPSLATGVLARPAMFCGYEYDEQPLDTYADMTQVLARESWPADSPAAPKSIAYFCSPLKDPDVYGQVAADRVQAIALKLLNQRIPLIWPRAQTAGGKFDWDLLVDTSAAPGSGDQRLKAQYFVGLANPSDRYTASFAGSSKYRLWPNDTGYANLVIAGDWVQTTFNIGCIESTVMSGKQAANVVRGVPLGQGIAGWGRFSAQRGGA